MRGLRVLGLGLSRSRSCLFENGQNGHELRVREGGHALNPNTNRTLPSLRVVGLGLSRSWSSFLEHVHELCVRFRCHARKPEAY